MRIILSVIVFLLWGAGISSQGIVNADTLRLMTFNIYHGETIKGDFDLDYIARIIQSKQPAFVALQEVDFKTKRARDMDIVTELGLRSGMAPFFGPAMSFDGGAYGVGLLSKWPVEQSQLIQLPGSQTTEPRVALEVSVVLPSWRRLLFVSTHLDHTDTEVRHQQMVFLSNRYNDRDEPVILAGDFNEIPTGGNMQIILEDFEMSDGYRQQPTYPSSDAVSKIDYIFLSKGHYWQVITTEVVNDSIASDHRALYSKVVLSDKE